MLMMNCMEIQAQNLNNPNRTGPLGTQVNTLSGNVFIPRTDIFIEGRAFNLNIGFYYNSFFCGENYGYGKGWNFEYNIRYSNDTTPGTKLILWGDGREDEYDSIPGGAYKAPKGFFTKLEQYQPGKYRITDLDSIIYFFDNSVHRKITRMEEPNGNYLNFTYTDSLLTSVINTAGQAITFNYNQQGMLASIVDAIAIPSRTFTYTYDAASNLKEVTDPLGNKYKYSYLVNGPMKTITDKNSNTINIIYYPDYTASELIGCNKRISFSYDTIGRKTVVTDHLSAGNNQVTTYTYQKIDDIPWVTSISGNCCGFAQKYEYDASGNITKRTDAKGNVYTFTHDDKKNVLTSTDPLGNQLKFTYTSFNRVKTFTDAKGKLYTINYDTRGNPVQLIQPGGFAGVYSYAPNGDLVSYTDPNGNVTTMTYDAYGYLTQINRPLGISVSYINDARGNITSFTDARGFMYTGEYDLLNRLVKTTNPSNKSRTYTYDAAGNVISTKNENGQLTFLAYDASNRLVQLTNAKGFKSYMAYDAMDNMLNSKDPEGNTTTYVYDKLNRMIAATDAAGNKSQFAYDANGNLVTAITATGSTITNTYDKLDRITRSQDQDGIIFNREYDANGNLTRRIGAIGDVTEFTYDDRNRLISLKDALGNSSNASYDNNGNMLTLIDRKNKTSTYAYDALNRLISFTDRNGFVTTSTYDLSSNPITVKDQNNNTTSYQRDNLGRQTRVTFPDGKYIEYTYDNIGNILTNRRTDGSIMNYVYDSINRLITKTLPGNDQHTYTYDAMRRLLTATNSSGVASYAYDVVGRKSAEAINGKTVRYTYNTPGREQTTIYPDSSIVVKKFTTRGLLASITKDGIPVTNYDYSPSNRLTRITYGNGIISNRQFDFANRLNTINTAPGNIQEAGFSYDNLVNRTAITKNNNPSASEQFAYDNNNRLINYKRGPAGSPVAEHAYQYDSVGNRTSVVVNGTTTNYTTNNLNQVTGSSGATNVTFTYDDNGNLTYDGVYFKKYDAERRLLLDSASPSNKIGYSYDATGRRITKTINGYTINYVYAGLTQLQQIDAGADTVLNSTVFANFLRPVLMTKGSNSFYYHQNEMNSVEAITTGNGSVAERYQYDPFGKQTIFNSSGGVIPSSLTGNRFGFTGHENDTETKSIHFPARDYSPETGNFNQRDPLGYYAGMGMYQYVNNNPSNSIDLLGLEPVTGSETTDQMISDGSSLTQGVSTVAEGYLLNKTDIQGAEAALAKGVEFFNKNVGSWEGEALTNGIKALTSQRDYVRYLKSTLEATKNKLKFLDKLNPVLTGLDVYWKIELYRKYKAKCPGSDEDMLQQSIMVKDITVSYAGLIPGAGIISAVDFSLEKIFGKSPTTKIVETTFWTNEWMNDNLSFSTPFGDVNLNPWGPLNKIGSGLGYLSAIGGSEIPITSDAFYANPVNYIK